MDRLREVRCPWKVGNALPGPVILLIMHAIATAISYLLFFVARYDAIKGHVVLPETQIHELLPIFPFLLIIRVIWYRTMLFGSGS